METIKIKQETLLNLLEYCNDICNGGAGSGDFGHAGNPPHVGGSEPVESREKRGFKSKSEKAKKQKNNPSEKVGNNDTHKKYKDKINKLIEQADSVSMFDSGSIEKREHEKNIEAINDLKISEEEKREAINKLNNYHEKILEHLAKSPTSAKIGPEKFKDLHSKSLSHYEKALDLKSERNAILKNLEEKLKKEKTKQENKKLFEVSKEALEKGLLEFEHNGEIWFRKTKRRQGFTQLDKWSQKDYDEMKSKNK